MSDGNSAGDRAPQGNPDSGSGRGTTAVGTASVGRATVPGAAETVPGTPAPSANPPAVSPSSNGSAPSPSSAPPAPSTSNNVPPRPTSGPPRPSGRAAAPSSAPPFSASAPPFSGSATAPINMPSSGAGMGYGSGAGVGAISGAGVNSAYPTSGAQPGFGAPTSVNPAIGTGRAQVGPGGAVRNVRDTVAKAASRGPRRARLQVKKIDPWSVMKFSFAVSLVLFIVGVVATALLYTVLDALGVFQSLNDTLGQFTAPADGAESSGSGFAINAKLVIGGAAALGAVNMVLFTALATLGAFIYNVCADLVGGVEVTLAERD